MHIEEMQTVRELQKEHMKTYIALQTGHADRRALQTIKANADSQRNADRMRIWARNADKEHDKQSIIDRTHAECRQTSVVDKANANRWSIAKPIRELRTWREG
jgi:hypothetical protein